MNANVLGAIFRRNFMAYFSNPTGYVFICVFVLLSSLAAFWPDDFFKSNLANLEQLNRYFPFIMLVFIPAITMSIWAEERRNGTDELLLTIPAGDFDVVLGKYLAAVAIYSVSLLFSLVCNYAVLEFLGNPDQGLIAGTYFGYWLIGLAMLAVGMVASFLTANLTVGFILGALFNAPLAFASSAEVIVHDQITRWIEPWSLSARFDDFGHGVVSLASLVYFVSIVLVCLYLSMVLIGRRHWAGGRKGVSLGWHFIVRAAAMLLIAGAAVSVFARHDARVDVSVEQLSSLSADTRRLVRDLDVKYPVHIEAYVSPDVPESFVQTRLNLINTLRELESLGGSKLVVSVHDTDQLSPEAERAERQFGITGRDVLSRERGTFSQETIYLGVAVTSGLNKVVIPFMDRGIPTEYELVRSICTVAQQDRKRLGVLTTDARLYGGFDQTTFSQTPNQEIITELEKQYDVVQVDPTNPIPDDLDVLLAPQPSSLPQEQLDNVIAAVQRGLPTAIFEDPMPLLDASVPGTSAPRRSPQSNPFMGQQPPPPKGDINTLWQVLGASVSADDIVWQDYCPYPKYADAFPKEFIWIDPAARPGDGRVFSDRSPITSRLQQMLFVFPGMLSQTPSSTFKFEPLVTTGELTGTVPYSDVLEMNFFGQTTGLNPNRRVRPSGVEYVLAAAIREDAPASSAVPAIDSSSAGEPAEEETSEDGADEASADAAADAAEPADTQAETASPAPARPAGVNVVLVGDIDVLFREFFQLRAQGNDPNNEVFMNVDNVTFVLNTLDSLAGDNRFIEIRKRRPVHRTLSKLEEVTSDAREGASRQIETFRRDFDVARAAEEKKLNDEVAALERESGDVKELLMSVELAREAGNRRLQNTVEQLERKRDQEIEAIERNLNLQIDAVEKRYKLWAVLLPPIPPLLVGAAVFFQRRAAEREGVSRSRLR